MTERLTVYKLYCNISQGGLSDNFFKWNSHSLMSWWGPPYGTTCQPVKPKPSQNPLMWGIVQIRLNMLRQGEVAGHCVLFIFFKSSFAIAARRLQERLIVWDTLLHQKKLKEMVLNMQISHSCFGHAEHHQSMKLLR